MSNLNRLMTVCAVLVLASGISYATTAEYALDDNSSEDITAWSPGDIVSINLFQTDPQSPVIDKISVAWGAIPANTSAKVILWAVTDGAARNTWTTPNWLTPLQVVSTTVTASQLNTLVADPNTKYTHGAFTGYQTMGVVNDPLWTTYNITPTTITTQMFAVGVINANDGASYGTALIDLDTTIAGSAISWVGCVGPVGSLNTNLSNIGGNFNSMVGFYEYGYNNNPFLIRAGTPVPEPLTMGLVGMGIASLGAYIRRRVKA